MLIAPKLKFPKLIAEPIAASLLCAPIIVTLSGYLSLTSIVANVLAAPLVAPVTILGFVAALVPPIAPVLIVIAKIPASLITKIAYIAAEYPVVQLKSALILIFFAIIAYFLRRNLILLIPIFMLLTYLQRWPNNDWQIANCDVGQGDALVLKVSDNSAVVIDTGPEPKLIDQCLKSLSIKEIPLLILTHPHADHIGGLAGAIKGRRIGTIMRDAYRGEVLQIEQMQIEILWPDVGVHQFQDNGGEGSQLNNQSIVALITTPDYSLLTTGDIEPDVQQLINAPKVDYLKVAHHGSKYQDLEFTQKLNPKISIISVGQGNKYGHPNNSTLQLLSKSRVLRTDIAGGIAIDVTHNRISSSKVGAFGLPVLWRVT